MLPISLLIALLIAFGIDPVTSDVPPSEVISRVLETCGGITLVATLAFGLGFWVSLQASQSSYPSSRIRRRYALGARILAGLSLVVYGWIIHSVGWSQLVSANWHLGRLVLVDDFVIFLPYLCIQLLVWWGSFFAERALLGGEGTHAASRLGRYMALKSRQSLGLILPVILLYVIRRDVISRIFPHWNESALSEPIEIAVLGTFILTISPLFIRFAWPTRSLPDGALRRRLTRIAERLDFRFTDVLVWDTGNTMVNACATGILPRFRYILLSDALIESLTPLEVAAVFGHEVGHIAHRHLLYFGFFFLGSVGLLAVLVELIGQGAPWIESLAQWTPWSPAVVSDVVQGIALLLLLGLYFWLVFGRLSRRFERQADVFGSKVVSCDLVDCPPHHDQYHDLAPDSVRGTEPILCPVGIRIFAAALTTVARGNGQDPNARSWRHGSISSRIAFLEELERRPDRERKFQQTVRRLRIGLGLMLVTAIMLSFVMPLF